MACHGGGGKGPALLRPTGKGPASLLQPAAKRMRVEPSGGHGEVRFATADAVEHALQLSGKTIDGHRISVDLDHRSKDQTKVLISGLPAGLDWHRLSSGSGSWGLCASLRALLLNELGSPDVKQHPRFLRIEATITK